MPYVDSNVGSSYSNADGTNRTDGGDSAGVDLSYSGNYAYSGTASDTDLSYGGVPAPSSSASSPAFDTDASYGGREDTFPVYSESSYRDYGGGTGANYPLNPTSTTGGSQNRVYNLPGGGTATVGQIANAVEWQESKGKWDALSDKGAVGPMQVLPSTAEDPAFQKFGVEPMAAEDLWDPAKNREFGQQYLQGLLTEYDGDVALALAGYNAGHGAVNRAGRAIPAIDETQKYVNSIMDNLGVAPDVREEALGYSLDDKYLSPMSPEYRDRQMDLASDSLGEVYDEYMAQFSGDPNMGNVQAGRANSSTVDFITADEAEKNAQVEYGLTAEEAAAERARLDEKTFIDKYGGALMFASPLLGIGAKAINSLDKWQDERVFNMLTGEYEPRGGLLGFLDPEKAANYSAIRKDGNLVGALAFDAEGNPIGYTGQRIKDYTGIGEEFIRPAEVPREGGGDDYGTRRSSDLLDVDEEDPLVPPVVPPAVGHPRRPPPPQYGGRSPGDYTIYDPVTIDPYAASPIIGNMPRLGKLPYLGIPEYEERYYSE